MFFVKGLAKASAATGQRLAALLGAPPKAHLIDERSDKLTPSANSCIQGEWCFATASVSQTNNPPLNGSMVLASTVFSIATMSMAIAIYCSP